MVFASTRERGLDTPAGQTSLWIVKLGVEQTPRRLTDATAIDSHPAWTRDGTAIVFASTRDGGDFDLWRLAIANGRPIGAPTQLTMGDDHEVTPAIAPDGAILYAAVDKTTAASRLEERAADGTVTKLTPGPDEREPALSPDGTTIVFTSRVERNGRKDAELWTMQRGSTEAKQLVDLPPTDESGPVWSRDGRYVFATSVLPGDQDRPLFASVVFVDRGESPPRVRMLRDSAGALTRVTPAIATSALDVPALRNDPEYLPELAKIMAAAIAKQRMQQP
jgi:Tol biopolymer transport system component